jgi:hypothetical protein
MLKKRASDMHQRGDWSSVATRGLERTLRDTWEGAKGSLYTVFRIFVEGGHKPHFHEGERATYGMKEDKCGRGGGGHVRKGRG